MSKKRKRPFSRRPGAFDRFLGRQVDASGALVLNQKPLTKAEEQAYMQERRLGPSKAEALRLNRERAERFIRERDERIRLEYQQMVADAVEAGLLLEE